ncbi:AAA family ATPase [Agathobacter sp.]|uniref:AAA family ATPase n=1 Tax=Agathobacter sp. TaxID=2021311 RepID=UPI003AB3999C
MASTLKLPVGIENFEEIRKLGFYYIDKTRLIEQLLQGWGKVTLFTRPRRFGKTLNMSMLKSFFEIGTDESLFEGLYISGNKELCDKHMGKYPVIFLSLKSVEGLKYEDAIYRITELIGIEAQRFEFLAESDRLSNNEKAQYKALIALDNGKYSMDDDILVSGLQMLSHLLYKHYGKKTVILIDEYDVPLDKAFQNGYYKEMVSLIRGLFGRALKTNEFLQFAVLTGCLRVSKESIFTGLNNFEINSIVDIAYDEQFGFTDDEVRKLLTDYDRAERYPDVKEWYDGYHFGNTDIYCPWDVINFAKKLVFDTSARPSTFWINSSGNDMVKRFVDKADQTTRDEIEKLVAGGFVEKQLRLDLTYDEIDNTIDNLWSVLFTTGYLTKVGEVRLPDSESYAYKLVIPNKEVREVFVLQIQEWFKSVVAKDDDTMKLLSRAILDKDEKQIARQLNIVMSHMISILDTKASDDMKENFYHGLLIGLLRGSNPGWLIKSNRESGDGFSDILIKPEDPDAGIVIEVKYAKEMKNLDAACEAAMTQIKEKRYDEALRDEGRCDILAYGIAFCRKRCKVVGENIND